MAAQRKIRPAASLVPRSDGKAPARPWEAMSDPLHPMHQQLLRRFESPENAATTLNGPMRFAFIFYAAIAAWALVGLMGYVIFTII